jgi:probable HAF family extracellular repeat protein
MRALRLCLGGLGLALGWAMVARAGSMVTILDRDSPFAQALARDAQSWSGLFTMTYDIGGRWRDGALTVINDPDGEMDNHTGISDDGSVVSGDIYYQGDYHAFRWENGVLEVLSGPGDQYSYTGLGSSVSGDGSVVVGGAGGPNGGGPAYWQGGVRTFLPKPDGATYGYADAISADGRTIVGVTGVDSLQYPTLWHDGVLSVLPNLDGGGDFTSVMIVNDDGTVAAGTATSDTGTHLVRWVNGQLEVLTTQDTPTIIPQNWDISSDGSILLAGAVYGGAVRGLIWREGLGLRTFHAYARNNYGLSLSAELRNYRFFYEPNQMSADGQYFIGTCYDQNYRASQYMVYLDPADYVVPEPSSVCLVGCAVVGLLWAGRRSQMGLN